MTVLAGRQLAPVAFLPHGAGPLPLLEASGVQEERLTGKHTSMNAALQAWGRSVPRPKAALVISAHFETDVPTILGTNPRPPMLFDYYGFPPAAYELTYDAPGSAELALRTAELLSQAGIKSPQDTKRGYDHGVFIPLSLVWPEADVPLAVLSVNTSHDPEAHLRMGEALAPLRAEGFAVVGSGLTFHNMRAFFSSSPAVVASAEAFDAYLVEALTSPQLSPAARRQRLVDVFSAPGARDCQPVGGSEHLLPLLVAAAAAGYQAGCTIFNEPLLGFQSSGFAFA